MQADGHYGMGLAIVEERFERETDGLRRSWGKYDRRTLRDYMVQDVEDPRINIQSILTRHFLVRSLFGEGYEELMAHEVRFSLVVNWLVGLLKKRVTAGQLLAVLDALMSGQGDAEGLEIPKYVSETFVSLAMPNYMCDLFTWTPLETTDAPIRECLMSTFETIWREVLDGEKEGRISVLEPGCGSGNDYRFVDGFGIARLIDYTGLDICEKNISNAKEMFPDVRFEVGNVLELGAADNAFDYCFVHDLFEHLSIEAMEVAIAEVCRVTRQGVCVGFFNMHQRDEHIVEVVEDYHWNKLSAPAIRELFERHASGTEVIGIDEFLISEFGCGDTHNKGCYTFIIRM